MRHGEEMRRRLVGLSLLMFIVLAYTSVQAQNTCEYSPYWGVAGELWDPHSSPLKDYSLVGYHRGDDPVPYGQRNASQTFGPGRFTITSPMMINSGVLRGAGVDQTTLYFPKGMVGMGYPCPGNNCWDWADGVIQLRGTEVGLEDLTVEFPSHPYQHNNGQGFNAITLRDCHHCWVSHVRTIQADEGIGIFAGGNNTIEHVTVSGGSHIHVHMSITQDNLVQDFHVSGNSIHGLTGNWDTHGGVFANGVGNPVIIEPDHNGPTTTALLYSNIQGTNGSAHKLSDTFLWNYMNQKLCPLDIYTAQLSYRLDGPPAPPPPPPPPPPSGPVVVAMNSGGSTFTGTDSTSYQADKFFSGGSTYKTSSAIVSTTDDVLYQSERYGNFSYNIPVSNGDYVVTLKFAEIYFSSAGRRIFDVSIEGSKVVSNLDVFAQVGKNAALDITVPISVSDGVLNLNFIGVVNNAKISAIIIKSGTGTPPPSPPPPPPPLPAATSFLVNTGGGFYTDTQGRIWNGDKSYIVGSWGVSGGSTYHTNNAIANTTDDTLYQSERYGNFSYHFTVSPGSYTVILHFAEIYWNSSGKRVFDVKAEGELVLNDYDIYKAIGQHKAIAISTNVIVNDGLLTLEFISVQDNAKISAIEVYTSVP